MNIEEAVKLLVEGKKISHSSWGKGEYLQLDPETNQLLFYKIEYHPFHIEPNYLLSKGWSLTDNTITELSFQEALQYLIKGLSVKHDEMGIDSLEMNTATRTIVAKNITQRDFILDTQTLFSTDWKIYS